jgi:hypothetical protein
LGETLLESQLSAQPLDSALVVKQPLEQSFSTWVNGACVIMVLRELKHYVNPLHIYCRLRDMGIAKGWAMSLCRTYERSIFRPLLLKEALIRQSFK